MPFCRASSSDGSPSSSAATEEASFVRMASKSACCDIQDLHPGEHYCPRNRREQCSSTYCRVSLSPAPPQRQFSGTELERNHRDGEAALRGLRSFACGPCRW